MALVLVLAGTAERTAEVDEVASVVFAVGKDLVEGCSTGCRLVLVSVVECTEHSETTGHRPLADDTAVCGVVHR